MWAVVVLQIVPLSGQLIKVVRIIVSECSIPWTNARMIDEHSVYWRDRGRHLMNEGECRDESSSATSSTWDFGEPMQRNPCFCGK